MNNKIISIDTLKHYNDKISNYVDEKVSNAVDNLELDELNAILVDTDAEADDPIIPDYVTETELNTALSNKMDKVTLAKVATSGNYNDLTNKPTIPSAVTESTISGWGFTKNTGTYSKPSGGIPKSDLASTVQTSLGKADTALQSYTEQYKGTVTGVKINGTTKNPSSGVVDLGTVITAHQDISGKQDKLVSGTNIKTINGTSILGSGDIEISGGGDYLPSTGGVINGDLTVIGTIASPTLIQANGGVYGYLRKGDNILGLFNEDIIWGKEADDEHYITASGDGTKFLSDDGNYKEISVGRKEVNGLALDINNIILKPNEIVSFRGLLNNENIVISGFVDTHCLEDGFDVVTEYDEYFLQFTTAAMNSNVSLTLPNDVKWANGEIPQIEDGTSYELSITRQRLAGDSSNYKAVLTPFKRV